MPDRQIALNCPEVKKPTADARSCSGNQLVTMRLLVGNAGASKMPVMARMVIRDISPVANP